MSRTEPNPRHRTPAIAFVVLGCAVAIGACGGSSAKHADSYPYGPKRAPASLSRCMRANGVSGFPDPREGPNGGGVGFPGGLIVTGRDSMVVMGTPFSGPALLSAEKACKEYLPPTGPPPAISEGQKKAAIANAECMRKHGVPNFPDPTFSGGQFNTGLSAINTQTPAFKHAAAVCGGPGAEGERFSVGG